VSSSRDAIKRLVDAFERSDWAEIDVRSGGLRVHLSTSAPADSPATPVQPAPATPADGRPADGRPVDGTGLRTDGGSDPAPEAPALEPPAGARVVVSPSPGIFWRSPEPGLPPFTDLGHTVETSSTLCIVEVMKLMNHVKAGVGGEVVAVYCENGVAVQKGQALFAIAPADSTP
jgi:biotin carboxyl carrier protein